MFVNDTYRSIHIYLYVCSIYVGYGKKYTGTPYTPPLPPQIPEEYADLDEQV
jgi:hypothetical protein